MSEIRPERLGERLHAGDDDLLVVDVRREEECEGWHVPDSANVDAYHPDAAKDALAGLVGRRVSPAELRVRRAANVGQEAVPADELAELGPNNCAAE